MDSPPIITLTTDFGLQDGYVGAMCGVILRQCPTAHVVPITHDVSPWDIRAGGWALRNAWRWYPAGTIHVAVVDPGVGSKRRAILVRTAGQSFVGPDNGILPEALSGVMIDAVREITHPAAQAPEPSPTFHGRDVFAWAAGWLAAGHEWPAVGPPIPPDSLVRLAGDAPRVERADDTTTIDGTVMLADRFGNLVTTIKRDTLEQAGGDIDIGQLCIGVLVADTPVTFGRTFADVPAHSPIAYIDSSGHMEIALNCGSAAEFFGRNATIHVTVHAQSVTEL